MSFGEQMRARREGLALSRAELARRLGVTPSAISNYENNSSFPKEEVLLRLFDALHTEPNALFCDSYHGGADGLTPAERTLLRRYRALTTSGQQTVGTVLDALHSYQSELAQPETSAPRVIPLYRTPAAAGYASPVFGEDFDYLTVDGSVPPGAEFAVRIQGDSMEPVIADGSVVYLSHDPLVPGDVGIFCVDGDMLCKQYHRDVLGVTYLFSLNRARADADVVFPAESGRSLVCLGRVLLPHRPPLPM